ncbi:MAG: hypothetical protein JSW15_09365 [Deltaproteobacteria bacterium]|nr:MAG: hypothetical protein JSW15_09365 [Deltaproteobacteria bacterium]
MIDLLNQLDDKEVLEQILAITDILRKKLLILTHHYKRREEIDLDDFRGDFF